MVKVLLSGDLVEGEEPKPHKMKIFTIDGTNGSIDFNKGSEIYRVHFRDIVKMEYNGKRYQDQQIQKYDPATTYLCTNRIERISFDGLVWYYEGQVVDIITDKKVYHGTLSTER